MFSCQKKPLHPDKNPYTTQSKLSDHLPVIYNTKLPQTRYPRAYLFAKQNKTRIISLKIHSTKVWRLRRQKMTPSRIVLFSPFVLTTNNQEFKKFKFFVSLQKLVCYEHRNKKVKGYAKVFVIVAPCFISPMITFFSALPMLKVTEEPAGCSFDF